MRISSSTAGSVSTVVAICSTCSLDNPASAGTTASTVRPRLDGQLSSDLVVGQQLLGDLARSVRIEDGSQGQEPGPGHGADQQRRAEDQTGDRSSHHRALAGSSFIGRAPPRRN